MSSSYPTTSVLSWPFTCSFSIYYSLYRRFALSLLWARVRSAFHTAVNWLIAFIYEGVMCHWLLIPGVSGQCSTPPINLAVLEGTRDTVLVCNSPTKVSWEFKPTTDEIERFNIAFYSDVVAPLYSDLFDVNQTGLVIKTAQGKTTIPPVSTAGLYVINYPNSTRNAGAKLLVVRK